MPRCNNCFKAIRGQRSRARYREHRRICLNLLAHQLEPLQYIHRVEHEDMVLREFHLRQELRKIGIKEDA